MKFATEDTEDSELIFKMPVRHFPKELGVLCVLCG